MSSRKKTEKGKVGALREASVKQLPCLELLQVCCPCVHRNTPCIPAYQKHFCWWSSSCSGSENHDKIPIAPISSVLFVSTRCWKHQNAIKSISSRYGVQLTMLWQRIGLKASTQLCLLGLALKGIMLPVLIINLFCSANRSWVIKSSCI